MFRWTKLGRVFNPAEIDGIPWMREFAQGPCTLAFEDFIRVYFSCRPQRDGNGQYISYSGYVDLDRQNFFKILRISEKPILDLGKRGTFDEFGTYPVSVIRRGKEIWAYYAGWTRCESVPFNVAIGLATSFDDGKTFQKIGEGPILSYNIQEPFVLSGPKIRTFHNKYFLFYISGKRWIRGDSGPEPVYKIHMAESDDGIKWERTGQDVINDRLGEDEAQASPDVFRHNGKYHMYFCYRYGLDYRCKEKGYRIGYASSDDLRHWVREDSRAGIDISETGWDSEMVSYPHVFELDGDLYMFYLGNDVGKYGFGLAKLERDSLFGEGKP